MTKWIIGVILVVVVAAGVWWSGVLDAYLSPGAPQSTATTTPQVTQQTAQTPQSDLPTPGNDTSDAAMAQDAAAVDAQLSALASDSTNLDSSLSDKPVTQEF